MKLTPLDLRKQQFKKVFRGYDPDEVRGFVEKLAQDWEQVLDEHRRAEDRVREAEGKLKHYEQVELALQEALETARETARRAEDSALRRAKLIVEEAELRAQRITRDAEQERYSIRQDLVRLTSRQNEIAARLRAFLMSEMEILAQYQGDDPIGFIKLMTNDGEKPDALPAPRAQLGAGAEAPPSTEAADEGEMAPEAPATGAETEVPTSSSPRATSEDTLEAEAPAADEAPIAFTERLTPDPLTMPADQLPDPAAADGSEDTFEELADLATPEPAAEEGADAEAAEAMDEMDEASPSAVAPDDEAEDAVSAPSDETETPAFEEPAPTPSSAEQPPPFAPPTVATPPPIPSPFASPLAAPPPPPAPAPEPDETEAPAPPPAAKPSGAPTYRDWLSGLAARRDAGTSTTDAPPAAPESATEPAPAADAESPEPLRPMRTFFRPAGQPPPAPAEAAPEVEEVPEPELEAMPSHTGTGAPLTPPEEGGEAPAPSWSLRSLVTGQKEEPSANVATSDDERERIRRILEDLD